MVKKLLKKRRLFRKIMAPAIAAVTCVSVGSVVNAQMPDNVKVDAQYKGNEAVLRYYYTLKQFCEMCPGEDWTNCKTSKECLAKIKDALDYDETFDLAWDAVAIPAYGDKECYHAALRIPGGQYVTGKATDNGEVYIYITPEDYLELENKFYLEEDFFELSDDNDDGKNEWINEVNRLKRNKLLKNGAAVGIPGAVVLGLIAGAASTDSNNTVKRKGFAEDNDDDYDSDDETEDTDNEQEELYFNTKKSRGNWRKTR